MENIKTERGLSYRWYRIRWQIFARDNFTCQYCGRSAPNVMLEVDHKEAIVNGGTDDFENLVTCCSACNRGKGGLKQSMLLAKARQAKREGNPGMDKVLKLLIDNPEGLTIAQLVEGAKTTDNYIRVQLSRLKKQDKAHNPSQGFWKIGQAPEQSKKKAQPHKKQSCLTCGGTGYLEVKTDEGITYRPCPKCQS